ncbi:MAG: sulfite exporter TauE/SafE family protein [Bdellovibrionaceae bacterium]|nr:sulfite exporter TauE/SafE family protein [Pseudobdellovibrionaceae bacterium]
MTLEFALPFIYSGLIGLGVGLVSSMLGLGGGIVIVPLLPLLIGITPQETIGTSLLTVFFVTSVNVWRFHRQQHVAWGVGMRAGVFAAAGSYLAAKTTGLVPTFALHAGMTMALGLVAIMTFVPGAAARVRLPHETEVQKRRSSIGVGFASGLIGGFTGVGGGVLVTPLLARLNLVMRQEVVPTANVTIMCTSLAGALALVKMESLSASSWGAAFALGRVRLDLAIALFLGAQLTSPFGRRMQSQMNPRKRDWLIGTLLVALALRTFIAAWKAFVAGS